MAMLKVVSHKNKYTDCNAYIDVVRYIINVKKAKHGYICLKGLSSRESAAAEMEQLAEKYKKNKGTRIRHMILSFEKYDEISPYEAYQIAEDLIKYYKDDYQILAAVHENDIAPHIHIVMNTVRKWDGRKYKGKKKDYYDFISYSKSALRSYHVRLKTVK